MNWKLKKCVIITCAVTALGGFPAMASVSGLTLPTETFGQPGAELETPGASESEKPGQAEAVTEASSPSEAETKKPDESEAVTEAPIPSSEAVTEAPIPSSEAAKPALPEEEPSGLQTREEETAAGGFREKPDMENLPTAPDEAERSAGNRENSGLLTKDTLLKTGAGLCIGMAIALAGFGLWMSFGKKGRKKTRKQKNEKAMQRTEGQQAKEAVQDENGKAREAMAAREAREAVQAGAAAEVREAGEIRTAAAARETRGSVDARETRATGEARMVAAARESGEAMAARAKAPVDRTMTEETMSSGFRKPAALPDPAKGTFGRVHNVGERRNQQDSMGAALTRFGLLAVVSDGMGGLSDGEKVSQKAVQAMIEAAGRVAVSGSENPLFVMLSEANEQVLQMLGPEQIYKSGATLLAVLVNNGQFHWVAVGDSRIYLYCRHHLFQINREHIYKQQLIGEAVNKNISFNRVVTDPQRDRLVSFLGMGELKHVDGSLRPVDVWEGDKILLMSDGIFNTISEREILRILETTRNAAEAAALMEQQVVAAANPRQDNFTCLILDI